MGAFSRSKPSFLWGAAKRLATLALMKAIPFTGGASFYSIPMMMRLRPATVLDDLATVLGLIAEGLSNRQICAQMFLAEKTVKNYVSSLLGKLGMERRTQAAVFGAEIGKD